MTKQTQLIIKFVQLLWLRVLLLVSVVVALGLMRSLSYAEGEVWSWSRVRSDDDSIIRTARQVRNEGSFHPEPGTDDTTKKTVFDLAISLYSTPNPGTRPSTDTPNRANYEDVIRHFADAVCEQTNGQHRLGRVSVFRGGGLKGVADVVWQASGRPGSALSGFGINGRHIYMYDSFGSISITDPNPDDRRRLGYLLGHEWGHYAYGVFDEHTGDTGRTLGNSREYQALEGDPTVQEVLMSDAIQAVDATSDQYRWLNHSTSSTIGTLATVQTRLYGKSGWEVLVQRSTEDPKVLDLGIKYPDRIEYRDLTAPSTGYEIELPGGQSECRSDLDIVWRGVESTLSIIPFIDGRVVAYRPDPDDLRDEEEIAWTGGEVVYIKNLSTGELKVLTGHTSDVESLSFSRDGTQLASGGDSPDNTIKIWEVATGNLVRTIESFKSNPNDPNHNPNGHSDDVNTVSYSSDGTQLASGSGDDTIKIWEVATGNLVRTLTEHSDSVLSVSYSPDGTKLAAGSDDNTIKIWEVATGQLLRTLTEHSDSVLSVSYSPDGTKLAAGSDDNSIRIWDVSGDVPAEWMHIRTFEEHSGSVYSVSFSPDGNRLASGSADNTIKIWDISSGDPLLWPITSIRSFTEHSDSVRSVSYSPDGTQLASGSGDDMIRLWNISDSDPQNWSHERTLTGHSDSVMSVSFSPDGTQLASGGDDNTLRIWDVATGNLLRTIDSFKSDNSDPTHNPNGHSDDVNTVSFSPDGTKLVSGSDDNSIRLWDVSRDDPAAWSHIHTFTEHSGSVLSVSYSPDGTKIVSGSRDRTIILWDVSGDVPTVWSNIRTFTEHSGIVNSVSFSSDGTKIASGSADDTIRLWDISDSDPQNWSHIRTLEGHSDSVLSVSFSPDGTQLASGGADNTIRFWDVATGQLLRTITRSDDVNTVSFSPDGTQLASGNQDERVYLWDVATREILHTLTGHTEGVDSVSFSPDGTKLAAGSDDNSIRLWDIETDEYNIQLSNLSSVNITYPQPLLLTMSLTNVLPITGTNVTATITSPSSSAIMLDLNDDGLKGDVVVGDGIYSVAWAEYTQDGLYTVEVTANNSQNSARYTSLGSLQAKLPQGTAVSDIPEPPSINNETFNVTTGLYFIVQGVVADDHTGDTTMPNTCTDVTANNTEVAGKIETANDSDCFRIIGTDNTNISGDLVIRLTDISANTDTDFLPTFRVYDRSGTSNVIAQWTATDRPQNGGLVVRIPAASIDRLRHIVEVSDGATSSTAGGTYSISAGNPIVSDDPQYGDIDIANLSLTIPEESMSIAENTPQETLTITVSLDRSRLEEVEVTLGVGGVGVDEQDYLLINNPVTIPTGTTTATILLIIVDDNTLEDRETLSVYVESISVSSIINLNDSTNPLEIEIEDNDADATVSLKIEESNLSEEDGDMSISVELDHVLEESVVVELATTDDSTAIRGDNKDYTLSTTEVSIPAGETEVSVTLSINDDDVVEFTEQIEFYISSKPADIGNDNPMGTPLIVSIEDNDESDVSLSSEESSVSEAVGTLSVEVSLTKALSVALDVVLSIGGDAQQGDEEDYTISGFTNASQNLLTFDEGERTKTLVLSIIDDDIAEPEETIEMSIESVQVDTLDRRVEREILRVLEFDTATLTITIQDQQSLPRISVSTESTSVREGEEEVTITVSLDKPFSQDFSVELGHDVSSSTAYGEDYRFTEGEFTQGSRDNSIRLDFAADETEKTVPLTIINDREREGEEEIILTLFNVSTMLVVIDETSGSVSLSISANDSPGQECEFFDIFKADFCILNENLVIAIGGAAATAAIGWVTTTYVIPWATGSVGVYGMVLVLGLPLLLLVMRRYRGR